MKAAYIEKFGTPDVIKVGTLPDPVAGPGQVVVDVAAASINGADWKVAAGEYKQVNFPVILGRDFSGTVSSVGAGVTDLKVGDEVFGVLETGRDGTYCEKLAVGAAVVAKKPASLSHVDATALALIGLTAICAVEESLKLQKGETILIQGGAGGVAGFAIQLAKHLGARVIATGGDDRRLAIVKQNGADEVVNYRTADFVAAVKELTGGKGADVIYDPVGGEVLEKSMRAAAYGARLLVVGFTSGGPSRLMSNHVLIKGLTVMGVRAGETLLRQPHMGYSYEELPKLAALGVMRPNISHRFPMDRVADAFRALLDRQVVGKAVIEM
mgnify:CR=1 FL=1